MNDWILALSGTPEGARIALVLAVLAAFAHACFGALQKGRHDPWLTRGAIDFSYGAMALPLALFVVPWPEAHLWPIFLGMWVIHIIYKYIMAKAYTLGAYTVVYPVVRGLGPLVTVLAAGIVFAEHFKSLQWGGVVLLTCAIMALAAVNISGEKIDRKNLKIALLWALAGGVMVAAYTTYDAYGIRMTSSPMTFLVWFFLIDGLAGFALPAFIRWRAMEDAPDAIPLLLRGLSGGLIAFFSFGAIMLATRLDKVGEAAVLRETSTVFAALIGWVFLKEKVGPLRAILMALIALGAVLVEFGA